jgi:acyl-CoA thioester hydrolase
VVSRWGYRESLVPSAPPATFPKVVQTLAERFERTFQVGWGDLDTNAHMRNTAFLDRAADTRMHFFASHGFPVARFAAEKFGPVMVRDELTYRKELRLMEEYTVDLRLAGASVDGVRFRLVNTFRNTAREDVATVTSEGLWFDLERRRPRGPPKEIVALQSEMPRSEAFVELPSRPPTG